MHTMLELCNLTVHLLFARAASLFHHSPGVGTWGNYTYAGPLLTVFAMSAKVRDGLCLLGLAGSFRLREDRVSAVVFWKEGKKKRGARAPLRNAPKLTAQTAAPPSPRFKLDATGRATARCGRGFLPSAHLPTCPLAQPGHSAH